MIDLTKTENNVAPIDLTNDGPTVSNISQSISNHQTIEVEDNDEVIILPTNNTQLPESNHQIIAAKAEATLTANYNNMVDSLFGCDSNDDSNKMQISSEAVAVAKEVRIAEATKVAEVDVIEARARKKFEAPTMSPITSRIGDADFNPLIATIGDHSMVSGEAYLTYRDSLRLRNDPNLRADEKYMSDSILYFLDVVQYKRLGPRRTAEDIAILSLYFYQLISSPSRREYGYDLLLKNKSRKEIKGMMNTLISCFYCYDRSHVSACVILFIRNLFKHEYYPCEVLTRYLVSFDHIVYKYKYNIYFIISGADYRCNGLSPVLSRY
jgi:hypothetical protein